MCLSTVIKEKSSEPVCKNIAKIEVRDSSVVFTDIMGRQTVVNGAIISMDLMENIITVSEEKE